ncbi:WD repeat and coiled-coil-containing protein isoform X1 [Lingula anatina]|uniref:WD repeat and coiled-coil-containing protein n=1 Tax=Lingula anatina TaxID=7574 RepID=A0A1S3JUK9_LINAN|nr:WD repeat and coiled-coil-containing protein isoform X1 [Lingula anatina]|eukprot:XP_013414007.1 WD repeat and coiled-coil-containing protein isoform X1 [Lingula anatina]
MELGHGRLRRNGINVLTSAIHPKHGLAWTDGKSVFLVPITLVVGNAEGEKSLKLGEFEHVESLHWSHDVLPSACYLCVVHQQTVSLWYVEGQVPQLRIKQVRKINATPLSKGCLWNPGRDILCLVNKTQVSFYFRHTKNKGSFALPPIEIGKISCGAWAQDGRKMVLAMGNTLLVYKWKDIDKSINEVDVLHWTVPGLEGTICSLVSLTASHIACTAEIPLEVILKSGPADLFKVPDAPNEVTSESLTDSEEILQPKLNSDTKTADKLFCLETNSQKIHDISQLLVVSIESRTGEPLRLMGADLKGVLSPDLLYFEGSQQMLVVGSSNQDTIQIYSMVDKQLERMHAIKLSQDERPKGICGLSNSLATGSGLLIMVAKLTKSDPTFLPSSPYAEYELSLKYISMPQGLKNGPPTLFKELLLANGSVPQTDFSTRKGNSISSSKLETTKQLSASNSFSGEMDAPKIPPRRNSKRRSQLVTELNGTNGRHSDLELDRVDFSQQPRRFNKSKSESDCTKRFNGLQLLPRTEDAQSSNGQGKDSDNRSVSPASSVQSSTIQEEEDEQRLVGKESKVIPEDRLDGCVIQSELENNQAVNVSKENGQTDGDQRQIQAMENILQEQNAQMAILQRRIDEIARLLDDTSCVPGSRYQTVSKPETLNVIYMTGETKVQKTFLLDQGRLKLEVLQNAFDIDTVELAIDKSWCVLGSNIDGYVPIKFDPETTVFICGRQTRRVLAPKNGENDADKTLL